MHQPSCVLVGGWWIGAPGETPSEEAEEVCRMASELWRSGKFSWLIVTGGSAQAMGQWFLESRIPATAIVVLDACDEAQVAAHFSEWSRARHIHPTMSVCAESFQAFRLWRTFNALGFHPYLYPVALDLPRWVYLLQALWLIVHWFDPLKTGQFSRTILHRLVNMGKRSSLRGGKMSASQFPPSSSS